MRRLPLAALLSCCIATPALAAGKFSDLEKCYQRHGQVEEVQKDGKKITTYKSEGDVAVECNEKVVAKAKGEKDLKNVNELATIVGRNWNWQSAVPVYVEGAKKNKAVCKEKDALYAIDLALSSPKDHMHSTSALAFLGACWPENKDAVVALLKEDANSYHKEHLCAFLNGKKALPANKQALCKAG